MPIILYVYMYLCFSWHCVEYMYHTDESFTAEVRIFWPQRCVSFGHRGAYLCAQLLEHLSRPSKVLEKRVGPFSSSNSSSCYCCTGGIVLTVDYTRVYVAATHYTVQLRPGNRFLKIMLDYTTMSAFAS